jgi:hypothetical protein
MSKVLKVAAAKLISGKAAGTAWLSPDKMANHHPEADPG